MGPVGSGWRGTRPLGGSLALPGTSPSPGTSQVGSAGQNRIRISNRNQGWAQWEVSVAQVIAPPKSDLATAASISHAGAAVARH